MRNSLKQRVNSPSPGLGFSFSLLVNKCLLSLSKCNSVFIPTNSPPAPAGLTVIFHETTPFNSNSDSIVFPPPVIALDLLYSVPAELWNWNHPKSAGFPVKTTAVIAPDFVLIPISAFDVICVEECTSFVSATKDGNPKISHLYGNTVVDCHPMPRSMLSEVGGNHRIVCCEEFSGNISDEFLKSCCKCMKTSKQMSYVPMHNRDDTFRT